MLDYKFQLKHLLVLAVLAIAIIIASIDPLEFSDYLLHQLGTVLMLIALFVCQRKYGLSFFSFCCYLFFLLIHVIAAHYLYSYVPYSEWTQNLFGFNLDQLMGWQRNMYDRLVHFSYGLLLYPFFNRLFECWLPNITTFQRSLLVIQFVMATSLVYEWIEWAIALHLSPEDAENYNGQQGDIWDAHKDMFVATIGACFAGFIHWGYGIIATKK